MRYRLIGFMMLLGAAASAPAQVSINFGFPEMNIGINVYDYPDMQRVPGYPVYYAPRMNSNYFFYDGMYWVYQDDDWYASSWYNGPWDRIYPEDVPLYVLRIPVRYYRQPPTYFRGWQRDAPPRWGEHWGRDWDDRRRGWDRWDRRSVPAPAPLPVYQRNYGGDRYPRVEQQREIHNENYRYQPKDPVVRPQYEKQNGRNEASPAERERGRQAEPQKSSPRQDQVPRQQAPQPQERPRGAAPNEREKAVEKPAEPQRNNARQENAPRPAQAAPRPLQAAPQPQNAREVPRAQPPQEQRNQGRDSPREPNRGAQGQEKERDNNDERRQERGK